jgi:uncharacterized protein DUF4118
LPVIVMAMHYGSTVGVLTSFASALTAAYFCFPPKFSFFISDPLNVAELGFFLLLAVIASKAVAVVTKDDCVTRRLKRNLYTSFAAASDCRTIATVSARENCRPARYRLATHRYRQRRPGLFLSRTSQHSLIASSQCGVPHVDVVQRPIALHVLPQRQPEAAEAKARRGHASISASPSARRSMPRRASLGRKNPGPLLSGEDRGSISRTAEGMVGGGAIRSD